MTQQLETKTYKFTFKHINHSVFRGQIVATSEVNRDEQMLSLLYNRYRRKLQLDSVYGKVEFVELTDKF
jgi:hypothetical protein